jgi:hypothetical protein
MRPVRSTTGLTRTAVALTVLALGGLSLSGCDGDGEGTATTPPTTATPSATKEPKPDPTPEPTETTDAVDPHPAITDLIITTSGVGPLTVGVPPATNPGAAMIAWDPEFCSGEGWSGDGDPGRWVPDGYDSDTNYMGEPATAFYIDADDASVYRIDVMGTSPRTAEDVRVGTLLTDLQAAYPGLAGPFAGPVSQVWWVTDAAGSMVFETQGGEMIAAGAPEQVILIRVLAPGLDPAFAAANSGNVAGACF